MKSLESIFQWLAVRIQVLSDLSIIRHEKAVVLKEAKRLESRINLLRKEEAKIIQEVNSIFSDCEEDPNHLYKNLQQPSESQDVLDALSPELLGLARANCRASIDLVLHRCNLESSCSGLCEVANDMPSAQDGEALLPRVNENTEPVFGAHQE